MISSKNYLAVCCILVAFCFSSCKKDSDKSAPFTITSVLPTEIGYGDTLTIKGSGLLTKGKTPAITLNGKPFGVSTASNTEIKAIVPKMGGSGNIIFEIAGKQVKGPSLSYKYKATVTTVAGNGYAGSDDGESMSAGFNYPWGIVADTNGDLYVADGYNSRVRKISAANHMVSTIPYQVAGEPFFYFSPYNIAIDTFKHDIYVTDFNKHIVKISAQAQLTLIYNALSPTAGIAVGPDGYLYMANNVNGTIYKMKTDGTSITEYAHNLITPRNIVFGSDGRMFVSAGGFNSKGGGSGIYSVTNVDQFTNLVLDNESQGWEIAVDKSGNFYEADFFKNRLRMVLPGGKIFTLAGGGTAIDKDGANLDAQFNGPRGITIDNKGVIYITTNGNRIRKVVVE